MKQKQCEKMMYYYEKNQMKVGGIWRCYHPILSHSVVGIYYLHGH